MGSIKGDARSDVPYPHFIFGKVFPILTFVLQGS